MGMKRIGERILVVWLLLLAPLASCRDSTQPRSTEPATDAGQLDAVKGGTQTLGTAPVLVGAGDIATCTSSGDEATASLLDTIAGTVFTTGDNVYASGALSEFNNCYDPSWGRHKARTQPAAGEREYLDPGASGYFTYFGAAAGDPTKGYYSYNLGTWHVVVLNSAVAMGLASAQESWLQSDLTANPARCTVAIWDQPRFYTYGLRTNEAQVWSDLYGAGAELVINGHQRNYERFALQRPDGSLDPQTGIREIIAASGGVSHGSFDATIQTNSEVRDRSSYGVLKVTLNDSSYTWKFIPVRGSTFTDAGTNTCHGTPAPSANPGGPYTAENVVQFNGTGSIDPNGGVLTYAWKFGDGGTDTSATPTHTYTANGTYTVSLTVTNASGSSSAPATTTAQIQNIAPTVVAGADMKVAPGGTYNLLGARFSDPGNDGPFPWSVDWGDGSADSTGSAADTSVRIVTSHPYSAAGRYRVTVSVTDAGNATSFDTLTVYVAPFSAQAAILIGAGDIAECGGKLKRASQTAAIIDSVGGTVMAIGDLAYPNGTAADYANCYDPTWGHLKPMTMPVLGNHEYDTGTATAYFDYFGDRAAVRDKGWYSFDLGGWHVVVLNDNLDYSPTSEQGQWLRADLAAHPSACTLGLWHRPYMYSVGGGVRGSEKDIWQPFIDAHAEMIINAHIHEYERFEPVDANLNTDKVNGMIEIIDGAGGAEQGPPDYWGTHTIIQGYDTYGVLKLTLEPDGATWQFISIPGPKHYFTDAGYVHCH